MIRNKLFCTRSLKTYIFTYVFTVFDFWIVCRCIFNKFTIFYTLQYFCKANKEIDREVACRKKDGRERGTSARRTKQSRTIERTTNQRRTAEGRAAVRKDIRVHGSI